MNTFFDSLRHFDYTTYLAFYNFAHDNQWAAYFYFFFAKYGVVLISLSFIYLIWKKTIRAFFCSFLAMSIAAVVDFVVYIFWRRPHPFESHYGEIIAPITSGMKIASDSFPSAHTYVAFAVATSIFLYGHRRLGVVLFVIALFIGIGRIGAGLHYPVDIVAGALLGTISGIFSYQIIKKAQKGWE